MKIVHAADIHIGAGRTLPGSIERITSSLNDFFRQVSDIKPDLIILAGDIYENKEPLERETAVFNRFIVDLEMLGIPIIMIPGQHCLHRDDYYTLNTINPFIEKGLIRNIRYSNSVEIYDLGIKILAVPFHENDRLGQLAVAEKPDIVVAHVMIVGSVFESGKVTEKGYTIDFASAGYWALGDIHKHQSVAPNAWYSGSIYQRNFGEALPKGFIVYDTDTGKIDFCPVSCSLPLLTYEYNGETSEDFLAKLPQDCLLRIKTSQVIDFKLPDNVVRMAFEATVRESDSRNIEGEKIEIDLFDGLDVELEKTELTGEQQSRALEMANEIRQSVGI